MVERRTKRGRVFYGCSRYPECEFSSWKKPVPDPSSSCNGLLVQQNANETECVACGLTQPVKEKTAVTD